MLGKRLQVQGGHSPHAEAPDHLQVCLQLLGVLLEAAELGCQVLLAGGGCLLGFLQGSAQPLLRFPCSCKILLQLPRLRLGLVQLFTMPAQRKASA